MTMPISYKFIFLAWTLNLRGSDIPYNPVFYAYLFIGLDRTVLFIDSVKLTEEVRGYLSELHVTTMGYGEIWSYLRQGQWGDGRVNFLRIITTHTNDVIGSDSKNGTAYGTYDVGPFKIHFCSPCCGVNEGRQK